MTGRTTCALPGCTGQTAARRLCRRHYEAARASGELDKWPTKMEQRGGYVRHAEYRPAKRRKGTGGKAQPIVTGECILWRGNLNQNGYGRRWVRDDAGRRVQRYAHRLAWEEANGRQLRDDETVDHLCGVSACVNPAHLEAVTRVENTRRAGARITHCPQGHEYTDENTAYSTGRWRTRTCRTCHREKQRKRAAKAKAA